MNIRITRKFSFILLLMTSFFFSFTALAENYWSTITVNSYKMNFRGLYGLADSFVPDVSTAKAAVVSPAVPLVVSSITPDSQVVKIGSETANLIVRLTDSFGNPVSGHNLSLISSAVGEMIETSPKSGLTDQAGQMIFQINSANPGLTTYSFYDVSANFLLAEKARVVYFEDSNNVLGYASTITPNFTGALPDDKAWGSASGPIDHFKFENVPAKVAVGENITLKLTALDSKEQVVTGYLGKIRFFIDGDNAGNADLPEDYTFVLQGHGTHAFSLAFSFKQPGSYKLKVADLQNLAVTDELTIDVVASGAGSPGAGAASTVVISSPTSGTSGNNIQVITG